ncbi:MAG TPA: M20/M25/M40 family metallo-hydrolase [Vicinamibacterales bacterium]|jgi:Zn-dependent M28 family amino/carboxypeptidase|nr:M20/M25/M40 family metallo-hydrolase [Vicinamibacterales bacterium]
MHGRLIALLAAAASLTAPADPHFSEERFKAHVVFLADDLLEGREAGTRGHDIAARYIAAQFALAGVAPGAGDGGYLQPVNLLETIESGAAPEVTITTPGGRHTLKHGETTVVRGAIGGGPVHVKAPMVFVGYGMKDAASGFDDYRGLDVRGKIVVMLFGFPKGMNSEVGAHLRSEQGRVAALYGAAAVLAIPTRATIAAVPWERMREFWREPDTTWVGKDGKPFGHDRRVQARALVDPRAAAALFDGSPRSLDDILAEADQAGGRPAGFALKTAGEVTVTTTTRPFASPNVVGVIEGSDPALKNEYVVLMGHADHIGTGDTGPGDRINNGALDNGAGVATLIEVGRALVAQPDRLRRSIMLVAVTAEEKGLLGAEYFAHHPPVPIERITAAVNLDMPMLLYEFTDVVAYGAQHSTLADVIAQAGRSMGVGLSPDPMPDQGVFVRSDHYPMVKAGVPAVMLATGMANGGDAAWGEFLTSRYHRPSDDLAQPILWKAGAKFAEFNYRAVRALADADAAPLWYERDYFGDLFAPRARKASKPAQ